MLAARLLLALRLGQARTVNTPTESSPRPPRRQQGEVFCSGFGHRRLLLFPRGQQLHRWTFPRFLSDDVVGGAQAPRWVSPRFYQVTPPARTSPEGHSQRGETTAAFS
jgi:hypothetical protein